MHGWSYSYLTSGLTTLYLWVKDGREHVFEKTDVPWEWMDIAKHVTIEVVIRPSNLDWMLLRCLHTCHMFCNLLMCLASRLSRRHSKNIEILEHWHIEAWEPRRRVLQVGWLEDWIELLPQKISSDSNYGIWPLDNKTTPLEAWRQGKRLCIMKRWKVSCMWGMEWHHATILWTKIENPICTLWIQSSSRRKVGVSKLDFEHCHGCPSS